MSARAAATAFSGLVTAAALLTACDPAAGDGATNPPTSKPVFSISGTAPGATTKAVTKAVPALVGMGLQAAQDKAQSAGFRSLTSHDSAGRDRHQVLDRDWKVCSQSPAAGKAASTDTELDLGAVKTAETCPKRDQSPPGKAGKTMPDLAGRALNTARDALPSSLPVTSKDATGSRTILLESNWKVCTQDPKAGTALTGQRVTFTAVKFGETCP